ncbi:helix-turn-helix domain-containing protein [Rothia halotolerans]|uniref:helix-turn-helix domain-containing protein n=1 Tax=Rothia halotolerans TaxID=405770 RepID=UPI00101C7329|nr:helix-turn-helix transcriptional regulator [Rothia halotolerans]
MATPEEIFAHRLRHRRMAVGMTQAELAHALSERLGVTLIPTAVNKIEKGLRGVKLNEAAYAAEVLRIPLVHLLGGDDDEHDVEIRHAEYAVEKADLLLRAAQEEVERREEEVEAAKEKLRELEHQDLLNDLHVQQWPLRNLD